MKLFGPIFKHEYYQKMLTPAGNNPVRNRATGFQKIFDHLDRIPNPRILETGCMRMDHGDMAFGDDGCATYLFDKCAENRMGTVVSVDINRENCAYAMAITSDRTSVVCSDSVKFLNQIAFDTQDTFFDLIYLDSFDIDKANPHPAMMHHIKELCAVMPMVARGTWIAVDDADAFFDGGVVGKATYVREFMEQIGAKQIHKGYQEIWEI